MTELQLTVMDLNERVFLEQALAWYREMRAVCREAPDGCVLSQAEQVALHGGRELVRHGFEAVLNEQAREAEKKGRRRGRVPAAKPIAGIADAARGST